MASHRIAHDPAAAIKVVSNWSALIPGDFVTVVDSRTLLHAGWIDDLTEDGAIIWLVLASGLGRRMFFREDGDRITVEASQPYA